MGNYYDDRFIFAVDNNGHKHLVAQCSSASLGGGYRDDVFINGKTYSVFCGVDDDDMDTEITGSFLPYVELIDCRSFFERRPTAPMQQAIDEAGLGNADIVKLIWMRFESNSWRIISSTGWVITADSESCIDRCVLDKAITKNTEIESAADAIARLVA